MKLTQLLLKSVFQNAKDCYINSLRVAEENNCKSIAFPSISTGIHGVPVEEAVNIVKDVLGIYQTNSIKEVKLILFSKQDFAVYEKVFKTSQEETY